MLTQFKNSKRAKLTNFESSITNDSEIESYERVYRRRFKEALSTKRLDLNDCEVTEEEALKFVVPFLMDNPEITSVDLSNNLIDYRGSVMISKIDSITTLEVEKNCLDDLCVEAISKSRSIRKLCLGDNNITTIGAKFLAKNEYIKDLSIWGNNIGNFGLMSLLGSHSIERLNVKLSGIKGASGLSGIKHNELLTDLDIASNSIGDSGAIEISKIRINLRLKASFCNIGDVGHNALMDNKKISIDSKTAGNNSEIGKENGTKRAKKISCSN